jgi:hypothetical protein
MKRTLKVDVYLDIYTDIYICMTKDMAWHGMAWTYVDGNRYMHGHGHTNRNSNLEMDVDMHKSYEQFE